MESGKRSSLLSGYWDLYLFADGGERFRRVQEVWGTGLSSLAESLLFHDRTVIPTHDLFCIAPLLHQLGSRTLGRLLDSGALRFARVRNPWAYIHGAGVVCVEPRRAGRASPETAPADMCVEMILSDWASFSGRHPSSRLRRSLIESIDETELEPRLHRMREIAHSFVKSSSLASTIGATEAELNNLGSAKDTLKLWSPRNEKSTLSTYLDIFQVAYETNIAAWLECDSITSLNHFRSTALAEIGAVQKHIKRDDEWMQLCRVAEVPDIGQMVRVGALTIEQVCDLRESTAGEAFRKWMRKGLAAPDGLSHAYRDLVRDYEDGRKSHRQVVQVLMAGATLLLGPKSGVAKNILGPVGTFMMDRVDAGRLPICFIEDLRRLSSAGDDGKPVFETMEDR